MSDGNGRTKGKLFEMLAASFFKTDPLYADRFEEVWLWRDYPDRNGRPDFGIDLVAKVKDGSLCAIQCKFYDNKTLTKSDINSFLEAASRGEFNHKMLFYSGRGYGRNVEDALAGHECSALNFESLANSNVDWPDLADGLTEVKCRDPYDLWDHQKAALNDVAAGLELHNRGQLIMACGTGKTLTSLRIAERTIGKGGLVLYAVPSISLMHQAIRYWSEQRTIPHSYVGVCSDPGVSHGDGTDIPISEMEIGVSTDPARIAPALGRDRTRMTVVFSTYQSMEAVAEAQKMSGGQFDLILCDEAHRTAGAERGSSFTLVHDDQKVRARKRLYMTATPRVYKAAAKTRAERDDVALYSMDGGSAASKSVYGPVLHRLGFSDAIDMGRLVDYEVIVLGVSERYGAKALQEVVAATTDAGDINLTDAARMLGLYRVLEGPDPENDVGPLQTAIAYTNRIADSEYFAAKFKDLILKSEPGARLGCEARHVDGTQNATGRDGALQWLRDSAEDSAECRVVSNVRCLSEGVDVPSLDAVAFLNPKSSEVEIIQAVGRVMRTSPGKDRGYVIIPIGIPPDAKPETILDDKETFSIVWSVLRALRSHDSRLDIETNTAVVRKRIPGGMRFGSIDDKGKMKISGGGAKTFPLGGLDVPADALYSRIVEEVGDRLYFARWAKDVAGVVPRIQERIRIVVAGGPAKEKFDAYVAGLREIIHDELTDAEGIEMLAQHTITRRIFGSMFGSDDFARQNPVSAALDAVLEEMASYGLDTELRSMDRFYRGIERRVEGLNTPGARQPFISELYGTFFKKAFPKMADRLGIVYTPAEIVDFILRSVDHALRENFGRGLTDENVNVIDPFTGAGTFVARMLSPDLGLIREEDLFRKYSSEIYANEIVLLAYYVAAVNCESTYGQRADAFKQFGGLSFTDTFNPRDLHEHFGDVMAGPKRRILAQRAAEITCVVGNPPYSAGQKTADEGNPNVKHHEIEKRVRETYVKSAPKGNKRQLYNTYIKALRWASDRIGESGVIGFITPSAWITGNAEAGIRARLTKFTDVWCFDLRGDASVSGEQRRREGGNVFGEGSKAPVAVTILVKNPDKKGCTIRYKDIGDYMTDEQKLRAVSDAGSVAGLQWRTITPDKNHDWLNQRGKTDDAWGRLLPIGNKKGKARKTNRVLFHQYSLGLATHRDAWVYNAARTSLEENMKRCIDYCNTQDPDDFTIDQKMVSWSAELSAAIKRRKRPLEFDTALIRTAAYRPFLKQWLYFDPAFIDAKYQIPKFFPHRNAKNQVIVVPDKIKGKFSAFITDATPDLEVVHHGQCFPFVGHEGKDNITDWALRRFRATYGDHAISKEDIFYYTYGLLHHPGYHDTYQAHLVRGLPSIPLAPDFRAFCKAGRDLAGLHLGYGSCPEHGLDGPLNAVPDHPRSIRFARGGDESTMLVNNVIICDKLPAIRYRVNGRTPVGWLTYRPKPSAAGIDRYPFRVFTGEQIWNMVERLAYVGMESDRIIDGLPTEFQADHPDPTILDGYSERP